MGTHKITGLDWRYQQSDELLAAGEAAKVDENLVWHYTNGPGMLSILQGHCLWATAAAFLNDVEEVELGAARLAARIQERSEDPSLNPWDHRLLTFLAAQVSSGTGPGFGPSSANFFILSASRAWDSLAMWRCYGGQSESYAVALDARSPLAALAPGVDFQPQQPGVNKTDRMYIKRKPWEPVRYLRSEQLELVDRLVDAVPARMRNVEASLQRAELASGHPIDLQNLPGESKKAISDVLDDLEQALLLIKHEGFLDERETRHAYVLWADETDAEARARLGSMLSYRSTHYGVAPYLCLTGSTDPAHLVASEPHRLPVCAIAISPSPNGELAENSLAQFLRANGYENVPVIRSNIPFRG